MEWSEDRNQPQARVLLDSISPEGHRLTTCEVTIHRFVLSEWNTHRSMSRNSASSRAIPVGKQIDRVRSWPAFPVSWPEERKGMQGGDEIFARLSAESLWQRACDHAVAAAQDLALIGVHKSVVNRLLEPFMWHTLIVTATDWDGFWEQRCSELAQPEIRVAAEALKAAYDASEPTLLQVGDWHTPLIQPDEDEAFWHDHFEPPVFAASGTHSGLTPLEARKRVSAARCARVSYLTHDGKRDIEADLTLYQRLVTAQPPHFSPLEHVATPCNHVVYEHDEGSVFFGHFGNFTGWEQLRHTG